MKCLHCQGEMKKGETPFHIDRKDCHLTLDRVPAWVCTQYGEPYFEAAEVDAIQDLIRSVEQKAHPPSHWPLEPLLTAYSLHGEELCASPIGQGHI